MAAAAGSDASQRAAPRLDVTLAEVSRILELQQEHLVNSAAARPSAESTVLGVPVEIFRAREPALLERVLRGVAFETVQGGAAGGSSV